MKCPNCNENITDEQVYEHTGICPFCSVDISKQKYRLWCNQRNQYFADGSTFETLEEIREQLIAYHSVDCNEESLKKQTIYDLIGGFEWEIHNLNGDIVVIEQEVKI